VAGDDLRGRRVLVTRTRERATGLVDELHRLGADVDIVPLIATVPITGPEEIAAEADRLRASSGERMAVFTSATAVRLVLGVVDASHLTGVTVAAVGPETARALRSAGVSVDATPVVHDADNLAAVLIERGVAGTRIWLPIAEGSSPSLPDRLRRAGGDVRVQFLYRSAMPADAPRRLRAALQRRIDAITLTSGSTARHLSEALDGEPLGRCVVACIGEQTAAVARVFGLPVAVVASVHTAAGLATALADHFSRAATLDHTVHFPTTRPRRLRRTPALRRLVHETALRPADLVQPAFVRAGISARQGVPSMPGQAHETVDSLAETVEEALRAGVTSVLLFGLPAGKDEQGSGAWDDDGIVQRAIRSVRARFDDSCAIITDCCLCEYTEHGQCGVLRADGAVDNDATLELYARTAVSQAAAGADVIAPSGMMDGQVRAIRDALDAAGLRDTAIMGYSAKFASVLYGPFRDAADCAPKDGDRRGYQMDPGNTREAVREALLDVEEGADIVMVKPALTYLDVVARVRDATSLPLAAFCISGEYAMLHHAAAAGAFEERAAVLEALQGVRRAGADIVITYHARRAAGWLNEAEQ